MRYYRALKDLSNGYKRHEVVPASAFKPDKIAVLLERGAIGELSGPTLSKLPGWLIRSEKLAQAGVTYAHELLDADAGKLAEVVGVRESTIEKWQQEAVKWLKPVPPAVLEQVAQRRRR